MPDILRVIVFISTGFILLLIELFTPGFFAAGISGIILLIAGSYIAYARLSPLWGAAVSIISALCVIAFFKFFPKSPVWKKITLGSREKRDEGFRAGPDFSGLLNKKGVTLSALKPSGLALIEGQRLDVASQGMFIEKDKKVKVIEVDGSRVVVQELER